MKEAAGQGAYASLRRGLIRGELGGPQLASETELAKYCGFSRTPVREALQRLELEGILSRNERGYFIPDPSPEEIYELYETRSILESASARLAADRRTDLDLATLRRSCDLLAARTDADSESVWRYVELSRALWNASHNRSLADALERLGTPHTNVAGASVLSLPGRLAGAIAYYSSMIQALEQRDAAAASNLALAQTISIRDARIEMWHARQSSAEWSVAPLR